MNRTEAETYVRLKYEPIKPTSSFLERLPEDVNRVVRDRILEHYNDPTVPINTVEVIRNALISYHEQVGT